MKIILWVINVSCHTKNKATKLYATELIIITFSERIRTTNSWRIISALYTIVWIKSIFFLTTICIPFKHSSFIRHLLPVRHFGFSVARANVGWKKTKYLILRTTLRHNSAISCCLLVISVEWIETWNLLLWIYLHFYENRSDYLFCSPECFN